MFQPNFFVGVLFWIGKVNKLQTAQTLRKARVFLGLFKCLFRVFESPDKINLAEPKKKKTT